MRRRNARRAKPITGVSGGKSCLKENGAARRRGRAKHFHWRHRQRVVESEEKVYEVEAIVDWRRSTSGRKFKVLWKGYKLKDATWEPESGLENARQMLDEFLRDNDLPLRYSFGSERKGLARRASNEVLKRQIFSKTSRRSINVKQEIASNITYKENKNEPVVIDDCNESGSESEFKPLTLVLNSKLDRTAVDRLLTHKKKSLNDSERDRVFRKSTLSSAHHGSFSSNDQQEDEEENAEPFLSRSSLIKRRRFISPVGSKVLTTHTHSENRKIDDKSVTRSLSFLSKTLRTRQHRWSQNSDEISDKNETKNINRETRSLKSNPKLEVPDVVLMSEEEGIDSDDNFISVNSSWRRKNSSIFDLVSEDEDDTNERKGDADSFEQKKHQNNDENCGVISEKLTILDTNQHAENVQIGNADECEEEEIDSEDEGQLAQRLLSSVDTEPLHAAIVSSHNFLFNAVFEKALSNPSFSSLATKVDTTSVVDETNEKEQPHCSNNVTNVFAQIQQQTFIESTELLTSDTIIPPASNDHNQPPRDEPDTTTGSSELVNSTTIVATQAPNHSDIPVSLTETSPIASSSQFANYCTPQQQANSVAQEITLPIDSSSIGSMNEEHQNSNNNSSQLPSCHASKPAAIADAETTQPILVKQEPFDEEEASGSQHTFFSSAHLFSPSTMASFPSTSATIVPPIGPWVVPSGGLFHPLLQSQNTMFFPFSQHASNSFTDPRLFPFDHHFYHHLLQQQQPNIGGEQIRTNEGFRFAPKPFIVQPPQTPLQHHHLQLQQQQQMHLLQQQQQIHQLQQQTFSNLMHPIAQQQLLNSNSNLIQPIAQQPRLFPNPFNTSAGPLEITPGPVDCGRTQNIARSSNMLSFLPFAEQQQLQQPPSSVSVGPPFSASNIGGGGGGFWNAPPPFAPFPPQQWPAGEGINLQQPSAHFVNNQIDEERIRDNNDGTNDVGQFAPEQTMSAASLANVVNNQRRPSTVAPHQQQRREVPLQHFFPRPPRTPSPTVPTQNNFQHQMQQRQRVISSAHQQQQQLFHDSNSPSTSLANFAAAQLARSEPLPMFNASASTTSSFAEFIDHFDDEETASRGDSEQEFGRMNRFDF